MQKSLSHFADTSIQNRFLEAAARLTEYLKLVAGKTPNPVNPRLPFFSALAVDAQVRATNALEALCDVTLEMIATRQDPLDSGILAWRTLQKLGFKYPSNAFEGYQGTEEMIQIYDVDQRLVFASLNFFVSVNYTAEDLYARPWFTLWKRDPNVEKMIFEQCTEVLHPTQWSIKHINSPVHEVIEAASPSANRGLTKLKAIAPVIDPDGGRGFICINKYFGATSGKHAPIVIPSLG